MTRRRGPPSRRSTMVRARSPLRAERALVAALGGGCQLPVGAFAQAIDAERLDLMAVVIALDGSRAVRAGATGPWLAKRQLSGSVWLTRAARTGGAKAILIEAERDLTERTLRLARRRAPCVYLDRRRVRAIPGLITSAARSCLAIADVVLYDHLVHPRLLRHARPDAEKIDVGTAAPQPLEQEAICYLLAEKAREGKVVARLKWGDPFVFDRGGAEALFLHEQGVPFEVVPGVPAGIGVRGLCGRAADLSRRAATRSPSSADSRTTARRTPSTSTGRPGASRRHARLLRGPSAAAAYWSTRWSTHGRDAEEPAALSSTARCRRSRRSSARSATSRDRSKRRTIARPGILIVGRVGRLREHLRWFDAKPLFGTPRAGDAAARSGHRDGRS